jgi:hypothetical protein
MNLDSNRLLQQRTGATNIQIKEIIHSTWFHKKVEIIIFMLSFHHQRMVKLTNNSSKCLA